GNSFYGENNIALHTKNKTKKGREGYMFKLTWNWKENLWVLLLNLSNQLGTEGQGDANFATSTSNMDPWSPGQCA
ncbi:hypothetical protein ACJX0J_028268, partial [Zea mays]